jgi:hypothetical protein
MYASLEKKQVSKQNFGVKKILNIPSIYEKFAFFSIYYCL